MPGKVFFITGTSTGFGAELVKVVLKNGDIAIATARKPESLDFKADGAKEGENYLALALDVTDNASIDAAFKKSLDTFKHIDIVVNNAGYGVSGAFEGLKEDQIRQQFEVNFFGLINVTKRALKFMRESGKGGVIQQVTSIGGQRGVPSFSIYCATKWAVEGFTEAVANEVKPEWNIKLTCIEPGGFRTDWSGRSMVFGEQLDAYDHIPHEENAKKRNGTQGGDPAKAAVAMHKLALLPDPPLRVVLGSDAYEAITGKLETYKENIAKYKDISLSCDVDE